MPKPRVLAALLLLASASLSMGEDGSLDVRVETRRALTCVVVRGKIAGEKKDLVARVRRGERTALEHALSPASDGSFEVELATTARLLPDEYVLEVAEKDKALASSRFRVGREEEVAPARESLRRWLLSARRALRDLATLLERRGRYHRAQLLEDAASNGGRPTAALLQAQEGAWSAALVVFSARLRTARMDFAQYEREVVLSPFPEAGAELGAIFPALIARREKLKTAMQAAALGEAGVLDEHAEILELARRSLRSLDESARDDAEDWEPGPLASPERPSIEGARVTSALGYSFELPDGWRIHPVRAQNSDDAATRLHFASDDAAGFIHVRALPDASTWGELARLAEVLAAEDWGDRSYAKLESKENAQERSYRILAKIGDEENPRRLLLLDRAPAKGKMIFALVVIVPEEKWEARRAEVEKLASSFLLSERKP